MDLGENGLAAFGLIASSIIAIVANSLLLVVFCRRRGLRTISNRFVINLLFANVVSSVLLLPTFILDSHLLDNSSTAIFTQSHLEQANFTTPNNDHNDNTIVFASQQEDTAVIQSPSKGITIVEERSQEEIIIDSPLQVIESTVNYTLTLRSQFNSQDDILCFLSEFVVTFACTACIFSVLLIGVDQYFAVLHPLRYQSYINKSRSVLLVLLTWFVAVLFGVGSALTDANVHYFRSCQSRQYLSTWTVAFAVFYLIVAIIVPFVTICDIYVCIYSAAHKNSARVRKVTSMNFPIATATTASTLKKTHSAPNFSQFEAEALAATPEVHLRDPLHLLRVKICRTSSDRLAVGGESAVACRKDLLGGSRNLLGQIRHKLSNASVFRYREESRTAKISLLVIFMVLLCYGPYGVSLLLNAMKASKVTIFRFNSLSLILLISSNIISPFLFAYRNRRIQRELAKFLRIIPQSSLRRKRRNCDRLPNIVIQRNSEGCNAPASVVNHNNLAGAYPNESPNFGEVTEPFLGDTAICDNSNSINNVVNVETDLFEANAPVQKRSILKRVCSSKSWNYKKCSFITVPDSCLDARGSFSSASTQVSTEEC